MLNLIEPGYSKGANHLIYGRWAAIFVSILYFTFFHGNKATNYFLCVTGDSINIILN